jgi:hypothetical protein
MTTCEPLPDGGEDDQPLTLWPEDSPASPSVRPGRSSRRLMSGGSGRHSRASFATYDPATSSWRTSRVSLDGEWETYSETWPRAGMTRNGTAYQRRPSVPRISETESGSWPTPKGSAANYGRPQENDRGDLQAAVLQWPTPTASCIDMDTMERQRYSRTALAEMREAGQPYATVTTGLLNPEWVEWLMGYPEGWTDCGDSETPSSPRSPSTSAG